MKIPKLEPISVFWSVESSTENGLSVVGKGTKSVAFGCKAGANILQPILFFDWHSVEIKPEICKGSAKIYFDWLI